MRNCDAHVAQVKQTLWNSLPSTCNRSIRYTVFPQLAQKRSIVLPFPTGGLGVAPITS